jgi:hypothetical protein
MLGSLDARLGLLRRVDETLEQLLHLLLLAVEMLLVALQALDQLLAVREAAPAAAVSM